MTIFNKYYMIVIDQERRMVMARDHWQKIKLLKLLELLAYRTKVESHFKILSICIKDSSETKEP